MKQYRHVIFDLDGTLTDSKPGIIHAALYASREMGIVNPPLDELNRLIGVPLQEYFRMIYGFTDEQIDKAVFLFRKYYGERGVYENEPYPGIPELLKLLHHNDLKIYISTAKYEKYAWVVAHHFGFAPLLTDLVGADEAGVHATKPYLASKIIERNHITDLEHTVTVGDKHMDMQAGKQNKIDTIGVSYGFGSCEELENESPTFIVGSVEGLSKILLVSY